MNTKEKAKKHVYLVPTGDGHNMRRATKEEYDAHVKALREQCKKLNARRT